MGVKITKNLLENNKKFKSDIRSMEMELHEMRTNTDAGMGSSTILDYKTGYPRPQTITGFNHELYDKRRRKLEKTKEKAAVVEEWIESIEDTQTRMVFRKKYIERKTWLAIAKEIGYPGNVDYPRQHIRDKYLKEKKIH